MFRFFTDFFSLILNWTKRNSSERFLLILCLHIEKNITHKRDEKHRSSLLVKVNWFYNKVRITTTSANIETYRIDEPYFYYVRSAIIPIFYGACNNKSRECNNKSWECNNETWRFVTKNRQKKVSAASSKNLNLKCSEINPMQTTFNKNWYCQQQLSLGRGMVTVDFSTITKTKTLQVPPIRCPGITHKFFALVVFLFLLLEK